MIAPSCLAGCANMDSSGVTWSVLAGILHTPEYQVCSMYYQTSACRNFMQSKSRTFTAAVQLWDRVFFPCSRYLVKLLGQEWDWVLSCIQAAGTWEGSHFGMSHCSECHILTIKWSPAGNLFRYLYLLTPLKLGEKYEIKFDHFAN